MKYIIYKTTNLLNGMFYIGAHSTNNLNDGYLGSGKRLKRAIKKYGKENFASEILFVFSSKDEMFSMEKEIVNESFVKNPLTYNLKIGGSGGNPGIIGAFLGKNHSSETKEKIRTAAFAQITTEEKRKKCSSNNWSKKDPLAQKEHMSRINKGIPKSREHREKLKQRNLGIKHDIVFCPHCGKSGGERAMKRYHFDNCKKHPEALK